jgi:surface antigen
MRIGFVLRGFFLLTLLAGSFASFLAMSSQAWAASGDYGKILGTEQRYCSDLRCAIERVVPADTWVQTWCWRDGGLANGTVRWFRIRYGGGDGWVSANGMSPQPDVPYCSDVKNDEALFADQEVWSTNGLYVLRMQSDGNLVSYGPLGALWSSRTAGSTGARAVMQSDGNLVLYVGSTAIWTTGTAGYGGSYLSVQDDGNIVSYWPNGPTWASSWHRQWGQTRSYNAGTAGNCTWYANERFKAASGVYPAVSGDAYNWNDSASAMGWLVISIPATQSIVVFEPYVQGSGALGHVAWVDAAQPRSDGIYIHIVEMNFVGYNVVSDRWVKHVVGMTYIMAPSL